MNPNFFTISHNRLFSKFKFHVNLELNFNSTNFRGENSFASSRNCKDQERILINNNINKENKTDQEPKKRGIIFENVFRIRNSVDLNNKTNTKINLNSLRYKNQNEQMNNLYNSPYLDFDNFNTPIKSNDENSRIKNYHLPKINQGISNDNNNIVKLKNLNFNKTSGYFNNKGTISFNNTFGRKFHKIKIVDMKKIKEKIENKEKEKEKEKKKNPNGNNNDSFIDELTNILINVNTNKIEEEENKQNEENKSIDNDKEPDPRINFEQIQRVNLSRPQTSYGGLNTRKKNLQSALQNSKYRTNNYFFQKP